MTRSDWRRVRRALTLSLGVALIPALPVRTVVAAPRLTPIPRFDCQAGYGGAVRYYIADLKTSFPEHRSYSAATALTQANYRAVLDGLKANAGVNGVRLPIIPGRRSDGYSALYHTVFDYARSIGLLIYASPMSVGMGSYGGWSDEQYASWLADYANAFRPDVLSPFNEAGIDSGRMAAIVTALRSGLSGSVQLAGPDRQHVNKSLDAVAGDPSAANLFDIVDSHNADRDATATAQNWARLAAGGRPVWSSENPADWSHGHGGGLPGIDQAVAGGVQGLVIWMAKPSLVDDAGRPTAKAREIAAHLGR